MEKFWIQFWKYFSGLVLVGMFGALCQVAWWAWYPYDVIAFKEYCYDDYGNVVSYCPSKGEKDKFEGIITNINKKVKRGGMLDIEVEYDKHYDIPTTKISRQLVNDRYVDLKCDYSGALPVGKHKKNISVPMPLDIWPGRYQLVNVYTYNINPIRPVHEQWKSEWFEVLP